jgi:hypothetical protein
MNLRIKMNKDIIIFYHIFAYGHYKKILDFHLGELKSTGLYEGCKQINFGLVYSNQDDLTYVEKLIKSDDKLNLYYSREFENLPIKPIPSESHVCKIQLGEGETILKMVEFCKSHTESENHVYLFLHTKGVSLPKNEKKRAQVCLLLPKLDDNISQIDLQIKLNDIISYNVIHNWKKHLCKLNSKNLYYYIWNFFWMNGSLLKEFNITDYCKYSFRGQEIPIYTNRHFTSHFPLGVYEQVNMKHIFSKKFNKNPKNYGIYF